MICTLIESTVEDGVPLRQGGYHRRNSFGCRPIILFLNSSPLYL